MQTPKQIEDKKVDYTGTSAELLSKVQENAAEWQDKVVVITGNISSIDEKGCIYWQDISKVQVFPLVTLDHHDHQRNSISSD